MAQTPPSLLERIRLHPEDGEAWRRFDDLYRPLLSSWLRRYSIQPHDQDDLLQEVLQSIVQEMPSFHYDPAKGKFRGWLRTIMANRLRRFWTSEKARPQAVDSGFYDMVSLQLEDARSDLSKLWDEEHDRFIVQRALELIGPEFSPTTLKAFRRLLAGKSPEAVADELEMSLNAVYLAKASVTKRLRQEVEGLTA